MRGWPSERHAPVLKPMLVALISAVPSGLALLLRCPTLERVGYFQFSLRETAREKSLQGDIHSDHIHFAQDWRAVHGRIVRCHLRAQFRFRDIARDDAVKLALRRAEVLANDLPERGAVIDRALKISACHA